MKHLRPDFALICFSWLVNPTSKSRGIPFDYVMQPCDVKLKYLGIPWFTVQLEVGHNEIGDADARLPLDRGCINRDSSKNSNCSDNQFFHFHFHKGI